MTQSLFFYGTLCHMPLLEIVLGRSAAQITSMPASLPDHAVHWVKDKPFPMITEQPGATALGLLVQGLSATDRARLDYYEGGFDYALKPVTLNSKESAQYAQMYWPDPDLWLAGASWDLQDWITRWGTLSLHAAREIMDQFGTVALERLPPFDLLRARGWARQLADAPAPATVRRDLTSDAVDLTVHPGGYEGYFRLSTFDVQYPRFNGAKSDKLERTAFIAYDAALVIPYDPVTDRVVLIEQLRFGPIIRGDQLPWTLEPIAGVVDAGEDPADTAIRESVEEAGLELSQAVPMLNLYASPGYSSEYFHCFVGLCDLSTVRGGLGGLEIESEDIRSHVMPLADALALVDTGEVNAAPLAMMLMWLDRNKSRLTSD